jgi:glutathione peroxidase-family protein
MKFIARLLPLVGLALVAAVVVAQTPRPTSLAQQLRASHWQKRVLLVGAPTASQADFQQQTKLLAATPYQLKERDFLVIELPYDQLSAADRQYWQQKLKQPLTSFAVVLIGKDGGVKRTETKPLAPADLFGTVDKMPMRRQEAKRPKK